MSILPSIYRRVYHRFEGHNLRRFKIIRELNKKIQSKLKSDFAIVQGSKMYLGKNDNYNLSIYGVYEPRETELVKNEIKKGNTVIDIGASIGYYTLLFSQLVGETGKVFGFESSHLRFPILKKNVILNGYANIILENKAVSNTNGEAVIFGEQSKTITLNNYFQNKDKRIDFIKMDVEGHEKHVFEGMTDILAENHNLKILFEYHPQTLAEYNTNPRDLLELVESAGFKMYDILQNNKLVGSDELFSSYPNKINTSTNILCLRH